MDHEQEEDHYTDFLETLRFLFDGDTAKVEQVKSGFRRIRQELYGIDGGLATSAEEAQPMLKLRGHTGRVILQNGQRRK
jgi:hypothetical protein